MCSFGAQKGPEKLKKAGGFGVKKEQN